MTDFAAASRGPGRVDLFWVDADRGLWHLALDDGHWGEPTALGGTLASGPTATAWSPDEVEVFAIFPGGDLRNRYWDGTSWHAWESLGGDLDPAGQPACSSWGADRLDVFAPGRDGRRWHRWWNGERWVDWEVLE